MAVVIFRVDVIRYCNCPFNETVELGHTYGLIAAGAGYFKLNWLYNKLVCILVCRIFHDADCVCRWCRNTHPYFNVFKLGGAPQLF